MQITVNLQDLVNAYRARVDALIEECAIQAAHIQEITRHKQALADELNKKNAPIDPAPPA